MLVHLDALLLSSYTVVVYASGFEEAEAIKCRELKNSLYPFLVVNGLENALRSVMEVLNPQLLSPYFSLGEVL
jgi:hypothetical protein